MLKPLKKNFQQRESALSGERGQQERVETTVRAFFLGAVPAIKDPAVYSIHYDQERRCVNITATQKAVASEISLRAHELLEQLRRAGVSVDRLRVR